MCTCFELGRYRLQQLLNTPIKIGNGKSPIWCIDIDDDDDDDDDGDDDDEWNDGDDGDDGDDGADGADGADGDDGDDIILIYG